jgi:cell division protein FtsB
MLEFIKSHQNHPIVAQLRDVRSLGLIVFACIVLLVSWSGVKAIQSNYKLQQDIARLQQENAIQELKNNNQKLKNQYYNTPQYLELAARQNFGLALPGEKELIVPKEVALSHVEGIKPVDNSQPVTVGESNTNQPFYQRNFQAWINFFLNRQPSV